MQKSVIFSEEMEEMLQRETCLPLAKSVLTLYQMGKPATKPSSLELKQRHINTKFFCINDYRRVNGNMPLDKSFDLEQKLPDLDFKNPVILEHVPVEWWRSFYNFNTDKTHLHLMSDRLTDYQPVTPTGLKIVYYPVKGINVSSGALARFLLQVTNVKV